MAVYAGTYRFGNETYTVDKSGKIRDASGNIIGSVDSAGKVYSTRGELLGHVSTSGSSATFTTTSGQSATGTVTPSSPSQPSGGAPSEVAMRGGGIPSGAYQFGKDVFVVTPNGQLLDKNGGIIGQVDNGGRVTDIAGRYLGKFNPGDRLPGGQVTFTDTSGRTNTGVRITYTLGGVTYHANSPDVTVSGKGAVTTQNTHPYAGVYTFNNEIYTVWHDGKIYKQTPGGATPNIFTGLYVDPNGKIRSYDNPNRELGSLSLSGGGNAVLSVGGQTITGTIGGPNIQTGGTGGGMGGGMSGGDVAGAGGGTGGGGTGGLLSGVSSEELNRTLDFLKGLLTESTREFFGARDFVNLFTDAINQSYAKSRDIADVLERLGFETFDILHPQRLKLQELVNRAIERLPSDISAVEQLSQAARDLTRLPDREIQNLRQAERALAEVLTRAIQRQEPLAQEATGRLRDVLAGRVELPEFIRQDLERRERELRESLMRNLGTGYETSTPGVEAIRSFERLREGVLDEFRQQELARLANVLGLAEGSLSQSVTTRGNLADVLLRDVLEAARIKQGLMTGAAALAQVPQEMLTRAAGLQSGLIQDIGNIAKLGFSLGESLLGQRAKLAGLPLLGAQAKQELAINAINALGKAALLPAQARSTYMGLLFSALEPTIPSVNPGGLLNTLATVAQPSPGYAGIANVLRDYMPSSTPLASVLTNLGQTLGGGVMKALAGSFGGGTASGSGVR